MVRLASLPTFTYTDPSSSSSGKATTHTATSTYRKKTVTTRSAARNVIDLRKWRATERPSYWPSHLTWPNDITKSLVYSVPRDPKDDEKTATARPLKSHLKECKGLDCPGPRRRRTKRAQRPCTCTKTAWESLNDSAWFERNIRLELTARRGIGAVALAPLAVDTIVGEYLGELVPAEQSKYHSPYLLELLNSRECIGFIDSLRVGSWTRFVNHSCQANLMFEMMRVGGEMRIFLVVVTEIEAGEELTVHYGRNYWEWLGLKCQCGEKVCISKK